MLDLFTRTITVTLLLAFLQGCSWFKEKPPEYVDSVDGEPIQVPEDLDMPRYKNPIEIGGPVMRKPSGDELNPGPPRVVSTAGRGDANAFMAWSAQGVYLLVKDSSESVARRLGFTIQRSGMKVLEKGPDGRHRFEYFHVRTDDRSFWQKMKFWSGGKGPNYSGIYRTRLEPDGENTRVYLLFDSGEAATTASAEHVLGIFMERLG